MSTRLGIFGGSFNPIHLGHLVIADRAREALRLDRLILVPAADTPLKNPASLAPARHRLTMARLALRGLGIEVSDVEIRRGGTSWTIDTVEALAAARCFLVLGADAAASLPRWHRIRDLARRVTFAIAARPGVTPGTLPRYIERTLVPTPLLDISATDLRLRLRTGRSVRHLLPERVERYIRRNRLYGAQP